MTLKINWIPTDSYYRRILDAPDAAARKQLYLELLAEPWRPMMDMMAGSPFGGEAGDELSGARAWAWLLPEQTAEMAELVAALDAAGAWRAAEDALRRAAARFDRYMTNIPFDTVEGWLVLSDPARANPLERGYAGATDWFQPRLIGQISEANEYVLSRLPGLVAHEMHHLIRLRLFPWDMQRTSVADYIVLEGLAEAFAASLFGEQVLGYYVTDIDAAGLATARRLIGEGLEKTGFGVIRGYVFGDELAEHGGFEAAGSMPSFGGYAVGYHVVRAFMERTGMSIEETTFLPANEIVRRSLFFDGQI